MEGWVTLICDRGHVVEVAKGYCGGCPTCADVDHIRTPLRQENVVSKILFALFLLIAIAILAAYETMPHHW